MLKRILTRQRSRLSEDKVQDAMMVSLNWGILFPKLAKPLRDKAEKRRLRRVLRAKARCDALLVRKIDDGSADEEDEVVTRLAFSPTPGSQRTQQSALASAPASTADPGASNPG